MGRIKKLKITLGLIFELILITGLCIGAKFSLAKSPKVKIKVLSKIILAKRVTEAIYIIIIYIFTSAGDVSLDR